MSAPETQGVWDVIASHFDALLGAVFGFGVTWGTLRSTLNSHTERIERLEHDTPSNRLAKIEERIEQHAAKFDEQADANREIREKVATLADKDDVRELRTGLQSISIRIDAVLSRRQVSNNHN